MCNDYLELHLPQYLQDDVKALEDGRRQNLINRLDGLYNEVQSSINIAQVGGEIDDAQADYLRKKYLY